MTTIKTLDNIDNLVNQLNREALQVLQTLLTVTATTDIVSSNTLIETINEIGTLPKPLQRVILESVQARLKNKHDTF